MKHIGVVLDNTFDNDHRVNNELKFLQQEGYTIFVLCLTHQQEKVGEYQEKGLVIQRVFMSSKGKDRLRSLMNWLPIYENFWIRKTEFFLKKYSIDVLHTHDLYMAKAVGTVAKRNGLPMVLDLHEHYSAAILSYQWATKFPNRFLVMPHLWRKKEADYLAYADRLVVLSDHFKGDLLKKYSFLKADHIFVYPNVPDAKVLLQLTADPTIVEQYQDKPTFLYFGVNATRRGVFTACEAVKLLAEQQIDCRILLIGPIDKVDASRLKSYQDDPALKDRLVFFPWKDISELKSYVSASLACLSPIVKNDQHESGIANKVFQYMLLERPIIVSDCAPQQQIVEAEDCGLVFRSEDAEDLADKMSTLIQDRTRAEQMGQNGKEAVRLRYNLQKQGQALFALYQNI